MTKKSRNTNQKRIIEEIIYSRKEFFNAEEIFKLARKKDSNIGIATIYRFLKEMKDKNLLNSYICDRRTLYSLDKKSHCHFICEKTGKVIHFELDSIDFLKKVKEKIPGSITSFQLEIRGICEDCNNSD
ncbi:MAG: transcriptional repressor [Candidatus Pacearchaeota archaeon]|jgi:Fur family ferric uptake transcriptional regulator